MGQYKDFNFHEGSLRAVHGYIAGPIISLLDPAVNKCILDMGCGNGALTNYLIDKGLNCYGVDGAATGIAFASQKHPGRFSLMDFSVSEVPALLRQHTFDTIISTEVIEHLYDPRGFVRRCKSLLPAKGGQVIITTPYHGYLKNLMLGLIGKWDVHMNPLFDGGHIKMWSRKTLSKLLEEQGFTVTNFIGCGRYPYLWKSMLIKAVLN